MRELRLGKVYPITDSSNPAGYDHVELATRFLRAGIRFFQVRNSDLSDSCFYQQLLQIRKLCKKATAHFVVNDRVDLALAVGAHGVHLGQDDLPVDTARRLLGEQAIIGLSTHNRSQLGAAQLREIDYVALGPIFPTSTKQNSYPPLGVDSLPDLVSSSRHPVVAIGGISLARATSLWEIGVASVAVISDITHHPDPSRQISRYLTLAEETLR